jgi:Xaa-Pro aminopeptidase
MTEIQNKLDRIDALLESKGLDALLLQRVSSFAWATCGAASYINTASSDGVAQLLITRSGKHAITRTNVICNNIEAPRLELEENLVRSGWEMHTAPWYTGYDLVKKLAGGLKLGADFPYSGATDLSSEIAHLRADLTPEEGERFRELGKLCASTMDDAIRAVRPGMTEYQIAALQAQEGERRGVQIIVNLVATDERIFKFRHPLPTARPLDHYAMLVLCGRRAGLVCSITRLVYFGELPAEISRKAHATARVDAEMIQATRPGCCLAEVFACAQKGYAQVGFDGEWQLHHQGGPAGYEPREYLVTPTTTEIIKAGQAFAWNPSITGVKSEDTILVGADENEVISAIPGWPSIPVEVENQIILRPGILEIL